MEKAGSVTVGRNGGLSMLRYPVLIHPPAATGATMTRDQLAAELKRMAADQVSDIERAVKDGHKTIALNEIADLNRNLKALAAAVKGKGTVRA